MIQYMINSSNVFKPFNYLREINFDRLRNQLGSFKLPSKVFTSDEQIRLWNIVYLDKELRILRAKRKELDNGESFLFIL